MSVEESYEFQVYKQHFKIYAQVQRIHSNGCHDLVFFFTLLLCFMGTGGHALQLREKI